MIFDMV